MEITISRSMTPEMERAVQAVKEVAEAGDFDLSSVITIYDVIYLIIFLFIAVPIFYSCVNGLLGAFKESKKVRRANQILDLLDDYKSNGQAVDMDDILRAVSDAQPHKTTVRRKSGSTQQFDQVTKNILNALKMQRSG